MPFTVTMPKLSPTMAEGTIAKWHKNVGDEVEPGDLLLEIATDKATVEHNALDGGFLRQIIVEEGANAIVNQPIAVFTESKDESIEGYTPEGIAAPAAEEAAPEAPEEEQPVEQPAPQPTAALSQPAFVPEAPLSTLPPTSSEGFGGRILASPLARRLAKERGLDLTTVKGTGPRGRIMSRDLDLAQPKTAVTFGQHPQPKIPSGTYEEEPLSQMRKIISQRLQESKAFIPHFYTSQQINAEPIVALRKQLREVGLKVTLNDLMIRACALSLREHPVVNSGFNSVNNTIIRFKTIDISVAVSIPDGLITPIIRHADFKNVGEISTEVRSLAKRAKEGTLELHEFKGGSFTLSNLGMFGITEFSGIINPPQAALLAVSGVSNVPVVKGGEVVPGKIFTVTLSSDHRVIDGVAAAKFLKTLQRFLENPAALVV